MQSNEAEQKYREWVKRIYTPLVEQVYGISADDGVDMLLDLIDERIDAAGIPLGDSSWKQRDGKSLGQVAFEEYMAHPKNVDASWNNAGQCVQNWFEDAAVSVASTVRHDYESRIATMAGMLSEARHIIANGKRGIVEGRWLHNYSKWKESHNATT